jgi:branched-chain amino acid transport system substrate-binding protein
VPAKTMMFEGVEEFLNKYQARAGAEGVDPLGYYLGTWGYAYIQILGDAVKATKSLNDNVLAEHIGKTTFKTIMGDVRFGPGGEWAEGRMLQVQYHGIKSGELDQFRGMETQTVLTPERYRTGTVVFPFEKAR